VLEPAIHPINASANTIKSSALTPACSTRSHTLLIPFLLLWSSVFLTRTSRSWSHSKSQQPKASQDLYLSFLLYVPSLCSFILLSQTWLTSSHSIPKSLKIYTWAISSSSLNQPSTFNVQPSAIMPPKGSVSRISYSFSPFFSTSPSSRHLVWITSCNNACPCRHPPLMAEQASLVSRHRPAPLSTYSF